MDQPYAWGVLLESLHRRKDRKNAWIVHRVDFVETKTLIHSHASVAPPGIKRTQEDNRFVWLAMPVNLPTNPVRRSAKFAHRDLHKVRNEVKVASNATQGNFLLKLANLCVWIVTKEPFPKLELLSVPLVAKVK